MCLLVCFLYARDNGRNETSQIWMIIPCKKPPQIWLITPCHEHEICSFADQIYPFENHICPFEKQDIVIVRIDEMVIGNCLERDLPIGLEASPRRKKTRRAIKSKSCSFSRNSFARNLETRVVNWYIKEGIHRNGPWKEQMVFVFGWGGSHASLPRFEAAFSFFQLRLEFGSSLVAKERLERLNYWIELFEVQ